MRWSSINFSKCFLFRFLGPLKTFTIRFSCCKFKFKWKSNQEKSEVEGRKKLCFSLVLFKGWFNRYVTLGDGSEFCHEALWGGTGVLSDTVKRIDCIVSYYILQQYHNIHMCSRIWRVGKESRVLCLHFRKFIAVKDGRFCQLSVF